MIYIHLYKPLTHHNILFTLRSEKFAHRFYKVVQNGIYSGNVNIYIYIPSYIVRVDPS